VYYMAFGCTRGMENRWSMTVDTDTLLARTIPLLLYSTNIALRVGLEQVVLFKTFHSFGQIFFRTTLTTGPVGVVVGGRVKVCD